MISLTLVMIIAVAIASGLVGSFALMRRMALASDAISHVALPGLGIALLLEIEPLIGGAVALVFGALLIWAIEKQTKISTETVIGVIFSASLAIGSLITPNHELEEALFGEFQAPGLVEGIIGVIAALLIVAFIISYKEKMVLSLVSADVAKTIGLNVNVINLVFLILFSINVLLGLKFLGVLLMGALVIIPAAAAKNLAWNLNSDLVISVIVAVASAVGGFFASSFFGLVLGPTIIAFAAGLFLISMLAKPLFSK